VELNQTSWKVLSRRPVVNHPELQVLMEQVRLPDGQIISEWPIVDARNCCNVVVCNEAGQILVRESYRHGARRSSWQMVAGHLENTEEDPFYTSERLLRAVGYTSGEWEYLGGFVVDGDQHVSVAHFFLALKAEPLQAGAGGQPREEAEDWRWVSFGDLQAALLDGRINLLNDAANLLFAFLALERRARQAAIDRLLNSREGH
jgi:8-oxo-dGTP pyrophosphatase MutT (NUDIX family)